MIELASESIDVLCGKCGLRHNILRKDYVKPTLEYFLRSMGDEIEYIWHFRLDCPSCKNLNTFDIFAYEYPPGYMNWKDHTNYTGSIRMSKIKFSGDIDLGDDNNEGNEDE